MTGRPPLSPAAEPPPGGAPQAPASHAAGATSAATVARRVRAALWLLLALLAAGAVASEWKASGERSAAPDATLIDADVGPARDDLAGRLVALERKCAGLAEDALARTAGVTDQAALFTALEALPLPPAAGVQVEDRDGRVLAWAGTSVDDKALRAIPFAGDGAVLVDTRLVVRRTQTTPAPNIAARAICHLPFEVRFPLRNRFFASWSLAGDVRAAHRIDEALVLPPDATRGTPVASAFGGDVARIDIAPLSARAWNEAVDADLARRRATLLVAAALAVAALLAWESRRLGARRPALAAILRALLVAGLRTAIAFVPMTSILPSSPATDPGRYAHGLPLAFAASPADLLLTCIALLGIAACVRRAAQAAPIRPRSALPGLAAVFATACAMRFALDALVEDAVRNSNVEFLSDVTVLPQFASSIVLGAIVAAGIGAALLVGATWSWLGPAQSPGALRTALLAVGVGIVAVPAGPAGSANDAALAVVGAAGFAISCATLFLDAGVAARAAVVPLGIAVAVFAPLEQHVGQSIREKVESQVAERMQATDATAHLVVERTLDELAASGELAAALREGRLPRDLQLRLWAESPLSSRVGGSAIEIEPRSTQVERARFSVNLPPVDWLPRQLPVGKIADAPLAGRGPGRDGRWLVGSRTISDGDRPLAIVWVTLEVRPPSYPGLPELEILGPSGEADTRRAPALAVSRYDGAGSGNLLETTDAYGAVRPSLPAEVRERAVGGPSPPWITRDAGGALSVLVVPVLDGTTTVAFEAFSIETGGTRRLVLRGARATLCGALLGAIALVATMHRWARGARLRLAQRLVVSYVLVSGLPLLVLGGANRALAQQRSDESALRELREAVALLDAQIEEAGTDPSTLKVLELSQANRDEWVRARAYNAGHHTNVFDHADLWASSDQGLFDTDLLPRRLPGPVYREILVRKRLFHREPAHVGSEWFDVGYAPLRTGSGEIVGAVSVPLLHQRRIREADLADGITAILSLYLASLVSAVVVGMWLAARLTRPLRDLTTATQRVAAGDLSRPVPEAGPGELGEVVGAFNRMMRDLAESREKLVRAEKEAAWRDMARQVAHEVKNPLTPMRLAAEHLRRAWRDQVPDFSDVLERGVDLIVRQTESLKRIATAFSDFARLPGRRRDPTDVAEIARRVVQLYANTPHLTLRADVADGLPTILADPDELNRVLVNLAKNAVEAMEGRDGTLGVRVRRERPDERGAAADFLVVEVEDDGPGIPDDVLPRLFEPYFSTKTSGTGLGLAICKRAVEDLGGSIAVRSAAGKGTTVTVRLPVVTAPPPS